MPLVSHVPMMAMSLSALRRFAFNSSQVLGRARLNRMAIICNSMLRIRSWDSSGPWGPWDPWGHGTMGSVKGGFKNEVKPEKRAWKKNKKELELPVNFAVKAADFGDVRTCLAVNTACLLGSWRILLIVGLGHHHHHLDGSKLWTCYWCVPGF